MSGRPLSGAAKRRKKDQDELKKAASDPNQPSIANFFSKPQSTTESDTDSSSHRPAVSSEESSPEHDEELSPFDPRTQGIEQHLQSDSEDDAQGIEQHLQCDSEDDPQGIEQHLQSDSEDDVPYSSSQVEEHGFNNFQEQASECGEKESVELEVHGDNEHENRPQPLDVPVPIVFPTDKERFTNPSEAQNIREFLCTHGACQPDETEMPNKSFPRRKWPDEYNRSFSSNYYTLTNVLGEKVRRTWLAYSYRGDYCYCHMCWLFSSNEAQNNTFIKGVNDWKGLSRLIQRHTSSLQHKECVSAYIMFLKDKLIDSHVKKIVDADIQRWTAVLTRQFGLLKVITGLGLPTRGHREGINDSNPGVYLSLLKFMSTFDPVLDQHMKGESRIKYLSKTITEEQIEILAQLVLQKIQSECKEAKFYTVIADGTPDISHKDQMAVLLRYVTINRETKAVDIHESFIGYFHVVDGRAPAICKQLMNIMFDKFKLDPKYLVGQSYDGASVMSGKDGGVQRLLRNEMQKEEPRPVPYVHCPPHQLNLVLVHAAEKGNPQPPIEVRNFFDLVQEIYRFFSTSYRRWHILTHNADKKEAQHLNNVGIKISTEEDRSGVDSDDNEEDEEDVSHVMYENQDEKKQYLTLKSLCRTRWAARKSAVTALLENFSNVLDCLGKLIDENHNVEERKQSIDLQAKMDWTFLLTLIVWNEVLNIMDAASRLLQTKRLDLFQVSKAFTEAADKLQMLREDAQFQKYVEVSKQIWNDMGLEKTDATFKQTRIRRVKRRPGEMARDEAPSDPSLKFKVEVYYHVLDQMVGEIRERAEGFYQVYSLFGFLDPEILRESTDASIKQNVDKLIEQFPEEFTVELIDQVVSFKSLYFSQQRDNPHIVLDYLQYLLDSQMSDVFAQFEILVRRFLTLPIGIASAERSFNYLKRIKSATRANMRQERTRNLAVLAIERDVASNLDMKDVIQEFANKKARRGVSLPTRGL